ncbi:MAG: hypothetical protein EON90_10605 [Brevundimonas sp.]|nr:MAG: hypothetical protein EON90_10605 [Brevundimonas sp.]
MARGARLSGNQRAAYLACMRSQNQLPALFEPAEALSDTPARPAAFLKAVSNLFDVAFKALTSLGIRDRQYARVYAAMPAHICPFCGIEPMSSPDPLIPRESLDHYLSSSRYPFAAANLRNLAPAGVRCNSSHKLAIDILRDARGVRRRCFDPYGGAVAGVSLRDSRPLEGPFENMTVLPAWRIDLLGDQDLIATWDEVYKIRTRYRLNILDAEFRHWLDHLANWAVREAAPPTNQGELIALLNRYRQAVIGDGFADFLKIATFEMLVHHCENGEAADRVTAWLIGLLSPGTGAAVFPEEAVAA